VHSTTVKNKEQMFCSEKMEVFQSSAAKS